MNEAYADNRNAGTAEEEGLFRFTVSADEEGKRLDALLAALVEDCSRSYLTRLIAEGNVSVNGTPATVKKRPVKAGDTVTEGQNLMILEAMKMENEILSPKAGKVVQVAVTKSSTVATGDLLAVIG